MRRSTRLGFALESAAGIGPLTATVLGVPAIVWTSAAVTAVEHQELAIRWTAITTPADAGVVVHLDNDHHGLSASVACEAPAAAAR